MLCGCCLLPAIRSGSTTTCRAGHRAAVPEGLLIEGEMSDRSKLTTLLREKEIDAVMHFAAFALVNESVNDPALYYRNNVVAAIELLDAMREADVKKIVFSSTTATYGEPEVIPIAEIDAATTDQSVRLYQTGV